MNRASLWQNPKRLSCIRPRRTAEMLLRRWLRNIRDHCAGEGPYFATVRKIAEGFQEIYRNGMQKIYLPTVLFEELRRQEIIRSDMYYEAGQSYYAPASGLRLFNEAMRLGTPNAYEAEKD